MNQDFDFIISLRDHNRNRIVPIALYTPDAITSGVIPVIFSHGYNKCRRINAHSYLDYGYLLRALADAGMFAVSIRHDIDSDPLLSMEKPYRQSRMPSWEKGVANIEFVISTLKQIHPQLAWDKLILIGHSNGGDMTMLYTTHAPGTTHTVITLDHRRYPIPRLTSPRILSLRGCDFPADEGVIPSLQEQQKYGITIKSLYDTRHSDIGAQGTCAQHTAIIKEVLDFIKQ